MIAGALASSSGEGFPWGNDMKIAEEALEKKILTLLKKVTAQRTIDIDQSFEQMGIDSIVALELVMRLEREFGVSIPDNRMGELHTPRATVALVRELREINHR